jgi:hypothetical protein
MESYDRAACQHGQQRHGQYNPRIADTRRCIGASNGQVPPGLVGQGRRLLYQTTGDVFYLLGRRAPVLDVPCREESVRRMPVRPKRFIDVIQLGLDRGLMMTAPTLVKRFIEPADTIIALLGAMVVTHLVPQQVPFDPDAAGSQVGPHQLDFVRFDERAELADATVEAEHNDGIT